MAAIRLPKPEANSRPLGFGVVNTEFADCRLIHDAAGDVDADVPSGADHDKAEKMRRNAASLISPGTRSLIPVSRFHLNEAGHRRINRERRGSWIGCRPGRRLWLNRDRHAPVSSPQRNCLRHV
jgi:hypothetical protein